MDASIVGELTADGSKIVLIGTGADERLAQLAKTLQTLTPLFTKSKPPGALLAPATWATVVQLGHAFGPAWCAGPRLAAWVHDELLRRVTNGGVINYQPPPGRVPRPYQVEGAAMIAATGRALLFDDQGTGKTITCILGLVERANMAGPRSVFPLVCVVPASTVDGWVEEWGKWAPHVKATVWRGEGRSKRAGTADVYVTSYDTARVDAPNGAGPLVRLRPVGIVADECHLMKTPNAGRSLAVRRLASRASAFVGMSGTPITHHPGDLWPTLDAFDSLSWPDRARWVDRYCASIRGDYEPEIIGLDPFREPEFRITLLGQYRRVSKADVLPHLPPKIYTTRVVHLPPTYRKIYNDLEAQMFAELPDGEELSIMDILTKLNFLTRLAAAPADVHYTYTTDADGNEKRHTHLRLKGPSWKIAELIAVLDERPGQPVVTFSPSHQLIKLAGEAAVRSGRRVGYVVGGQTPRERTRNVKAFQAGELDLLCATSGAGGVGLTLTRAGTLVNLWRPWSIVEALQTEDRAHRIGSEIHSSIEIIDIMAADTIDARIRQVLHGKAGQLADLLQDQRIVTQLLGGTKRKAA